MERITLKVFVYRGAVTLAAVCLLMTIPALGQIGGPYVLEWSTIDGGGGQSSGGSYTLTCTIGQPGAGVMSGGPYELSVGFWPGGSLCIVDFHSFALFAEHWLDSGCNAGNDWCGGADLDQLGDVDGVDLRLFVNEWLYWCPYDWPLK